MSKRLNILATLLLLSCFAFAQEQVDEQVEQSRLNQLLDRYETQQRPVQQVDPEAEVRRLRNQIIDLRVERDALEEENSYLKNRLENIESFEESHPECINQDCVPVDVVENERILSYVIYSLSLYRMAEVVANHTPPENVEVLNQAQRVMAGVKSDLEVLGYDTTDMQDYPSLEELLREFQIAHTATRTR